MTKENSATTIEIRDNAYWPDEALLGLVLARKLARRAQLLQELRDLGEVLQLPVAVAERDPGTVGQVVLEDDRDHQPEDDGEPQPTRERISRIRS